MIIVATEILGLLCWSCFGSCNVSGKSFKEKVQSFEINIHSRGDNVIYDNVFDNVRT